MRRSKRGAIELSMSTIIIIILGVALLTFGIMWLRSIFTPIMEISDDTFDKAREQLGQIEDVNSLLTLIPSETKVEQGKDDTVKVVVANLERTPMEITIEVRTTDDKLNCGLFDAGEQTVLRKGPFTLNSGDQISESLIIKDLKGDLRTTGCEIKVLGIGIDERKGAIVKVIKSSGSFSVF